MESQLVTSITAILTAIIGVAIISVLVSKNANTTSVIGAGSSAFTSALGAALSPITGGGIGSISGNNLNINALNY